MIVEVQCAFTGVILARVEIYKVAYPPRRVASQRFRGSYSNDGERAK